MADSPQTDAEGVLRVTVASNGRAVPETEPLISASVHHAFGQIASARLVYIDGDMPGQRFPLSDSGHFEPGAEVSVSAGYGDGEPQLLFNGIVVQQAIEIGPDPGPGPLARLIVECRDQAVQMTRGSCSAIYAGQTDSAVIEALIARAGLKADVQATPVAHAALVQHGCTDWDFLIARAQASGLVVNVHAGCVSVRSLQTGGQATLALCYGQDLIAFRADTDRAALSQPASGPAAVHGRMEFQGSAKAVPGAWVELKGVGERFSGEFVLTDVHHEFADGNWLTTAEFRSPPLSVVAPDGVAAAAPASAGQAGVHGLQLGQVIARDADPSGAQRVRVTVPGVQGGSLWARLMQFHGSNGFGAFFVPEVGDEVVLGYFDDDPTQPVVLGSLYSSQRLPPYEAAAGGDIKAIVTRSGARIEFNEAEQSITLRTPQQNKIVLSDSDSDSDHGIELLDENGNRVLLGRTGIGLHSPKDIRLSAAGGITIEAVGDVRIASRADVKTEGLNVHCEAQVGFAATAQATAELSAAGQTTVKGALVLIN